VAGLLFPPHCRMSLVIDVLKAGCASRQHLVKAPKEMWHDPEQLAYGFARVYYIPSSGDLSSSSRPELTWKDLIVIT
jgi:hypothetical protein